MAEGRDHKGEQRVELRQLRYFLAVAEEGGFGRAAERLNIVQSAVSQRIRALERSLGVVLFDRSSRRVSLSSAGERLLPEARAVLAAADRAREVAAGILAGTEGVLRLGTVQVPGDRLYRALAELAALAPRVRVRLVKLPPAERLAAVRAGVLDAALVRALPPGRAGGLEAIPVWTDPLYAALPADHPLAGEPEPSLEQLAALPLRLAPHDRNPPFHGLITGALRAAGAEPPPAAPFTSLQATLADIGAGPPSWTVFYEVTGLPPAPGVVFRPLAGPTVTTSLAFPCGPPFPALRHLLRAFGDGNTEGARRSRPPAA
ncbi:LysR family transcriptional regulator [Streptomyces eurythermus]|uniref:LysR family transcriptional regulator n=1 Tax=Streptomyces eurythermus TaxID=42237 RepID=UPI0036FC197A